MKTVASITCLRRAGGNNELAEMVGSLHDRLARFMVMRRAGKTMEITHEKIIEALRAQDVESARQTLLDDIDRAHEAILDSMSWKVTPNPGICKSIE